ncbi:MAG TPA: RNA-splicing ligase RtcB, partial [Bacteroidales bacterium]|nr:RNA-splicing ligase RtcB [Bacteroidales bacterium]
MKKIKLRGSELKRLGYTDSRAISLANQLVSKHFDRESKMEALEKLEKIALNPAGFLKDAIWGDLAQLLVEKPVKA